MKQRFNALMSLLLVAFLATSAFAASGKGGEKMWNRMVTKLNLSTDQQGQLRPVFDAERQAMKSRRDAYKNEMNSVLTADQQAQLAKIKADRKACRKNHQKFNGKSAYQSLNLTADQKAQLKAFHEQSRPQMKAERKQYIAQVEAQVGSPGTELEFAL